ncbi:MAG TPA: hypothetical protein PLV13_04730 [Ilumatobacteraceae bacterium]|nr:hypothetical protein [Ilumatobacteraceae bacterium]
MLTLSAKRRRRWRIGLCALVVLIIAVIVVKQTVLNDDVHGVSTEEALQDFRENATPTTGATAGEHAGVPASTAPTKAAALPDPGVYLYRTTGFESIDAVGGSRHDYPDQTTITVVRQGCGVMLTWDALQERRDMWNLCVEDDGIALTTEGLAFHQFFGQSRTEELTCDRTVLLVPDDGTPRSPVQLSCLLGENQWAPAWEVMGYDRLTVGTEIVPVRHVQMVVADNDEYWEHVVVDWYLDENGLPVKVQAVKQSLSDTAYGDVEYNEVYTLELLSRTPLT